MGHRNKTPYIIGIAGGSGSGKTTFARRLYDTFKNSVAVVNCDNYYISRDDVPIEQRHSINYDSPEAFEFKLMLSQIIDLKNGKDICCPIYDFTIHNRSKEKIVISTKPIIIIDGILILSDQRLRDVMDMKIYVETDADERVLRRVRRDVLERGRSIDSIIEQYLGTVKPMHNLHVEPTKKYADLIINGGMNGIAFELIETKIKALLESSYCPIVESAQ